MPILLPFSNEDFQSIYSRVPRLCVDLVIKTDEGILLLLRQAHGWEGMWHFPGGTIYMGESILEAVKRKGQEEAGAEIQVEKMLGLTEYLSVPMGDTEGHVVSLVFLCSMKPQEIHPSMPFQFFKELPENIILEQKEFLEAHWNELS